MHGQHFREWCDGCGWVHIHEDDDEYEAFGKHKKGCRVAKKYWQGRIKKYGSERSSEITRDMSLEDVEWTKELEAEWTKELEPDHLSYSEED